MHRPNALTVLLSIAIVIGTVAGIATVMERMSGGSKSRSRSLKFQSSELLIKGGQKHQRNSAGLIDAIKQARESGLVQGDPVMTASSLAMAAGERWLVTSSQDRNVELKRLFGAWEANAKDKKHASVSITDPTTGLPITQINSSGIKGP